MAGITTRQRLRIGIDLDNTITQCPAFFAAMTQAMDGRAEIHIITNRDPGRRAETVAELAQAGIRYDRLEITAQKAAYIVRVGITVYFDDTDEYFVSLPESVTVFKTREPGNFDFDEHVWVYGDKTGRRIGG